MEFVAVAHPDHPLHRLNRTLTHDDLETHLQVVIRDSGSHQPRNEGWLGAEQRWTVTNMSTSRKLICQGLGFAWLPRHEIVEQLEQGKLAILPLQQGQHRAANMYLYSNKDRTPGPAARILAELIIQHSHDDG